MKDSPCTRCDEFVPGCAVCTPSPDASSAPVCASCKAGKYATVDVLPVSTHVHRVAQVAAIKIMSVAVSAVQEPTWILSQIHIAHAIQPVRVLGLISARPVSQENISSVMHLVPLNV
eukprot:XP_001704315.1 Variant-specific surface protein [Giardia lamblia ATCC 50803]